MLDKLGLDAGNRKVEEMLNTPATSGRARGRQRRNRRLQPPSHARHKRAPRRRRRSIVDLLKLLDIDSSLQARKELAIELGAPADVTNDSAKMNM